MSSMKVVHVEVCVIQQCDVVWVIEGVVKDIHMGAGNGGYR